MRKKFKPGDRIETIDSFGPKQKGTIIEYEWQFRDCALVEWDEPETQLSTKTVIERKVLKLEGQPEKQKKEQLLPIPKKVARKKPQGFAPVLADDFDSFYDDDIYYEDDDFSDDEEYDPIKHNPFQKFLHIPDNPTLNLPDNELYAACVCDGYIEGESIWLPVFKGSLDECLTCLNQVIKMNYNKQIFGPGLKPDAQKAKPYKNFDYIKKQCQEQGRAKVEWFWHIASKECWPSLFEKLEYLEDE